MCTTFRFLFRSLRAETHIIQTCAHALGSLVEFILALAVMYVRTELDRQANKIESCSSLQEHAHRVLMPQETNHFPAPSAAT